MTVSINNYCHKIKMKKLPKTCTATTWVLKGEAFLISLTRCDLLRAWCVKAKLNI